MKNHCLGLPAKLTVQRKIAWNHAFPSPRRATEPLYIRC